MKKFLTILAVSVTAAFVFSSCEKEDEYAVSMSSLQKGIVYIPDGNGHQIEAVDMGFITKVCWATCNLGANSPEQNGNFFSWGETQPKDNYTWNQYKWANYQSQSSYGLTKYNSSDLYGFTVDEKIKLDAADDGAKTNLGGAWRMPTNEECMYLREHTTHKFAKVNGVAGYIFTSTIEGFEDRSIFLPFAGTIDSHPGKKESIHNHEGSIGRYWTNTRCNSPSYQADCFSMQNTDGDPNITNVGIGQQDRNIGLPIRPVAVFVH